MATSSSLTVHIFRLGEEEALETKHKKKIPAVATILEEETEGSQSNEQTKSIKRNSEEFEILGMMVTIQMLMTKMAILMTSRLK